MTQDTVAATTGPPPPVRPPRRKAWWRAVGVVMLSGLGVSAIAANFVHVPYIIISPGEATPLDGRVVTIKGARTYGKGGDLLYLTVRITNHDPSLWRYLFAQLDDDVSVVKKGTVIGCATYAESTRVNDILMQDSQDTAKTLALRRLGYSVVGQATRALIWQVLCRGPSHGRLMEGDVVTAIDGAAVTTINDVGSLVQAHHVGDRVRVTVDRGGATRDVTVRLGRHDEKPYLGILMQTLTMEQFPIDISIDTNRVSGPSAGLAFTLAIIDDLTPGDLTGGKHVAVTGSVFPDGSVRPVGGVEQKTVTARENGAVLMLVPESEAKAARAHAGDMRVVAVSDLEDALSALRHAGGDALPPAPTATTAQ